MRSAHTVRSGVGVALLEAAPGRRALPTGSPAGVPWFGAAEAGALGSADRAGPIDTTMTRAPLRLRGDAAVRAVFASRRSASAAALVLHARRAGAGPARATVVASRKVGGAVERNRAKRRLRAVLRTLDLPAGWDLVLVARRGALDAPFAALVSDARRVLARTTREEQP